MITIKNSSVFKNKAYVRLFTSYFLSTIGDYFDYVALMIMIGYIWHLNPMELALYSITYALPGIIFSQLTGVIADRRNKWIILITSDLMRCLLTIFLLFAPNPWILYTLLFIRSTIATFNTPASQALIRRIVPEAQLLQALSYNKSVFQFTKIFAPFVGGTIAATTSPKVCLMINSASFVISAIILFTVKEASVDKQMNKSFKRNDGVVQLWVEGWKFLLSKRIILVSVIFYLLGTGVIQIIESQYTILFREIAPHKLELRGWFTSAVGLGAFLSVSILSRKRSLKKPGIVLGMGILLEGVMCLILTTFTRSSSSLLPLIGGLLGGIGSGILVTGFNYFVQSQTPEKLTGRVMGILSTLISCNMLLGPLMGGLLVSVLGPSSVFGYTSLALVVIGTIGLLFQKVIWKYPSSKSNSA